MSKEDFMEIFALTQSLPGVFAVNISIFVGYKLHKVKGSLVCALATILPSFVIMMLIAMSFAHFQDNQVMIRIFNGIRPAVVALIVIPCISAARALKLKYWQLVLPAIATILIWQFGLSPVYIVLAGIAGGMLYTLWLKDKLRKQLTYFVRRIVCGVQPESDTPGFTAHFVHKTVYLLRIKRLTRLYIFFEFVRSHSFSYLSLSYSSSVTGSSHSLEVSSPGTSKARWANQPSEAAPCQCFTFAGIWITVPGRISTAGLPSS